jgi:segregation and condensation protein A
MSETGDNLEQNELWPDGEGPVRLMPEPEDEGQPLIVDVQGFEGPLDLLLQMARTQKVDITRISILALAEQYLVFIEDARRMKLELAADYLVMAAWLAYLKSRLLLPKEDDSGDEPPPEELAARLQFRLQRLQAMRDAAAKLMSRNRLGRDVFQRGWPEPVVVDKQLEWGDTLIDLSAGLCRPAAALGGASHLRDPPSAGVDLEGSPHRAGAYAGPDGRLGPV